MNNVIELQNIGHVYGNNVIFSYLNLKIEKGEFICIYGPSGCGKSTLLNIIGQLQKPNIGKIIINNNLMPGQISKCSKNFLRHEIAYLFQNLALLDNETVIKNFNIDLKYKKEYKKKREEKYIKALEDVGLSEEFLYRKVYSLSGGEKQRIAIARIMLKNNPLLLADEPTASLDHQNAKNIFEMLKTINEKGVTVLVVTHDETMLKYATRIIDMTKQ